MPNHDGLSESIIDRAIRDRREALDRYNKIIGEIDAIKEEAFDAGWAKGKAWGEQQEREHLRTKVEALDGLDRYDHPHVWDAEDRISRFQVILLLEGDNGKA